MIDTRPHHVVNVSIAEARICSRSSARAPRDVPACVHTGGRTAVAVTMHAAMPIADAQLVSPSNLVDEIAPLRIIVVLPPSKGVESPLLPSRTHLRHCGVPGSQTHLGNHAWLTAPKAPSRSPPGVA